jgi:hypothetical protein
VLSFAQKEGKRRGRHTWCGRRSSRAKGSTKTWTAGRRAAAVAGVFGRADARPGPVAADIRSSKLETTWPGGNDRIERSSRDSLALGVGPGEVKGRRRPETGCEGYWADFSFVFFPFSERDHSGFFF